MRTTDDLAISKSDTSPFSVLQSQPQSIEINEFMKFPVKGRLSLW